MHDDLRTLVQALAVEQFLNLCAPANLLAQNVRQAECKPRDNQMGCPCPFALYLRLT